jgi:putative ABC transport system permease protein
MAVGAGQENLDIEIVGLVRDARYGTVKTASSPQFFTPHRQAGGVGSLTFYVRSSLPPEQLTATIYNVVSGLDPALPVERAKTMENQVRDNVFVDYLVSTVSVAFAALATLLAAVGLYGILAYTVAQRTSEIGLRAALGATPRQLRTMVLNEVGRLSLIGGVIGLIAAISLGYAAASLLFEVRPYDLSVVTAAVVFLGLIALCASYLPARRAASITPTEALRLE